MADTTFDLGTNSQVPLSVIATDASGAIVPGATATFASSDDTVLTVTDNGDGTAVAVRASVAGGTAVVAAVVTNPDGTTASGTLTLTVGSQSTLSTNVTAVEIVPGLAS
jgi:hypothetical protein